MRKTVDERGFHAGVNLQMRGLVAAQKIRQLHTHEAMRVRESTGGIVDWNDLPPIEEMSRAFEGPDGIQVLPAATYLQFGRLALAAWANLTGVFSIPTLELAEWLRERHNPSDIHEIGCGNGVLARHLGMRCSDGRLNSAAQQLSRSKGISHAVIPRWVMTREGTAAVQQFKPRVVLAQWCTPGGGQMNVPDGRNAYGPDYGVILENCHELIFIGNDAVHDKSLASVLPPADEELNPGWLLNRAVNYQSFIRIWRGGMSV